MKLNKIQEAPQKEWRYASCDDCVKENKKDAFGIGTEENPPRKWVIGKRTVCDGHAEDYCYSCGHHIKEHITYDGGQSTSCEDCNEMDVCREFNEWDVDEGEEQ